MDKPASGTLDEYKKLLDDAKSKEFVVQLGYMYRYNPAVLKVFKHIKTVIWVKFIQLMQK